MGLQMNSPTLHHPWKLTRMSTLGFKVNVISDTMHLVRKGQGESGVRAALPASVKGDPLGGKGSCGQGRGAQGQLQIFHGRTIRDSKRDTCAHEALH